MWHLAHRGQVDLQSAGRAQVQLLGCLPAIEVGEPAFTFELQRHSDAYGWGLMSNAAHPGYARTELIPNGPGPAA